MEDILVYTTQFDIKFLCLICSLNVSFFMKTRSKLISKVKDMDFYDLSIIVNINNYCKLGKYYKDCTELNYILPFGSKIEKSFVYYSSCKKHMVHYYYRDQVYENWYNRCVASILSGDEICSIKEMKKFRESIFYKVGYKHFINEKYGDQWKEKALYPKKCKTCLIFPINDDKICNYCINIEKIKPKICNLDIIIKTNDIKLYLPPENIIYNEEITKIRK